MTELFMQRNHKDREAALKSFYERVIEWNAVAGNNYNLEELYRNLVKEEIKEIIEAAENKDGVEYVKELADCLVVGSYYALCQGMLEDELLTISQSDEMHDDVLQWLGFTGLDSLPSILDKHKSDILLAFEYLYFTCDADMSSVIHEVMDSNFSKFIEAGEAAFAYGGDLSRVCKQIEEASGNRYENVTSQYCNGYIVFRDSKGKIVKPPCYRSAYVDKYVPKKYHV